MADDAAVLDAEYRAFVRSLHHHTIDTIIEVESWWTQDCLPIVNWGGYDPDHQERTGSKADAGRAEEQWRRVVRPRLWRLVHGHPDPDVRQAADFLDTRLLSVVALLGAQDRHDRSEQGNVVAVHLVHDGFTRLHRAAYHAPFRVDRPEPSYDGVCIGNSEPSPTEFWEIIQQFQAGGTPSQGDLLLGNGLAQAVQKLSDISFLPEQDRRTWFARLLERANSDEPGAEDGSDWPTA
ncbi:hypothetical protein [Nocardia abscessus]|uniref:hypothetical protein n=1 Tax=Nocardia abscessus TaxID=120957 RepID=UPI002459120A|nr:hypothetical protein [Nocardia abscessus]